MFPTTSKGKNAVDMFPTTNKGHNLGNDILSFFLSHVETVALIERH